MKKGNYSILTLLLVTAIIALSVRAFQQSRSLDQLQRENATFRNELGVFDEVSRQSILIRPLLNRGPNTWRYRIGKDGMGFRYGFGVVSVDNNGSLILPSNKTERFQWMSTGVEGDAEFDFSITADGNGNWYAGFFERPGYGLPSSKARLGKYRFEFNESVWNIKAPVTIVNDVVEMNPDSQSNGNTLRFDTDEIVVLFRSESFSQPPDSRNAFVVVFQKLPATNGQ